MATTLLVSQSYGDVLLECGNGTPDHTSPIGSVYMDYDSPPKFYKNTDGGTTWVELVDADVATLSSLATVGTLTSGNADAIVSAATTSLAGKIELATETEATARTDATRAITPFTLAAATCLSRVSGIKSDFKEDNAIKTSWDEVVGGAAAQFDATLSGVDSSHDGVFEGKTGSTATGFVVASYGDDQTGFRLAGGERHFECLIQVDDLSTASQEFIMRFGFGDEVDGTEHDNGAWFEYDRLTNTNWLIKTGNAATRTSTDSSVAVIIDTWIRLRAEVNAAGTSIEYFINGTSVGTITTNIPTVTINESMSITKSTGISSRRFLVDYYEQEVIYTTPR